MIGNDVVDAACAATSNTDTQTINTTQTTKVHGWMKGHEITHQRLVEAVELSGKLLGASTVVFMTVPFTNNVKTVDEMKRVHGINDYIREIATSWRARENTYGVRTVLILEYEMYYNHITWANARHIGYPVSHPLRATRHDFDSEGPSFLFDRLKDGGEWSPSVSMVCSDTESLGTSRRTCNRNILFKDGMHVCPEKLAGRYAAGLACLIGCAHNGAVGDTNSTTPESEVRTCEKECNEQFMSVLPVEESWIDSNTILASFPG